jgi:hypothetical protein
MPRGANDAVVHRPSLGGNRTTTFTLSDASSAPSDRAPRQTRCAVHHGRLVRQLQ